MLSKYRIFKGRFLSLGIALGGLGVQLTLLIENWLNRNDVSGNLITLAVFFAYFLLQLISQNIENQRQTTAEEFKSGSIIKNNYLSKAMQISHLRLWTILGATFVLGMQIAQVYWNWLNEDSLLFAWLGTMAMASLIVIQIIAQSNENRKTSAA
jgi:4-hydroxybenzoate polyprenyltransferase